MSDKDDITRLEDLPDFEHVSDPETESFFTENLESEDKDNSLNDTEDENQFDSFEFDTPSQEDSTDFDDTEFLDTPDDLASDDLASNDLASNDFSLDNELSFSDDTDAETDDVNEFRQNEVEFGSFEENETLADLGSDEKSDQEIDSADSEDSASSEVVNDDKTLLDKSSQEDELISSSPMQSEPTHKAPESFNDVKEFCESISVGKVEMGGNPPFSVMLKNIKFKEEAEQILDILKDLDLCKDDNESMLREGIENGSLLISQISEFSAIHIAHRLRRFHVDISLGLSDEIFPSKNYKNEMKGLVDKDGVRQNKNESMDFTKRTDSIDNILISTTPKLDNHTILRYIGVISEHGMIDLARDGITDNTHEDFTDRQEYVDLLHNSAVFDTLTDKLKEKAFKMEGNAIVDLSYQMAPVLTSLGSGNLMKVTVTASVVYVKRI